jgi:hypothetical protein
MVRKVFGTFSECSISCNPSEPFSNYKHTEGQISWLYYLQALLRDADISIKRVYIRVSQEMVENYWREWACVCVCVCVREREREREREIV